MFAQQLDVNTYTCLCIDPIWSGEAYSEGREGKRTDQGAACSQLLCSTLRLQTKQL